MKKFLLSGTLFKWLGLCGLLFSALLALYSLYLWVWDPGMAIWQAQQRVLMSPVGALVQLAVVAGVLLSRMGEVVRSFSRVAAWALLALTVVMSVGREGSGVAVLSDSLSLWAWLGAGTDLFEWTLFLLSQGGCVAAWVILAGGLPKRPWSLLLGRVFCLLSLLVSLWILGMHFSAVAGFQVQTPVSWLTAASLIGVDLGILACYAIPQGRLQISVPVSMRLGGGEKWTLILIGLIALSVTVGGSFFLSHQQRNLYKGVVNSLASVADLKVEQIYDWRSERLGDGRMLMMAPALGRETARFLGNPMDPEMRKGVEQWFESLRTGGRYERLVLFDASLNARLSVPAGRTEWWPELEAALGRLMNTPRLEILDLSRDEHGRVWMHVLVPVYEGGYREGTPKEPIGAVLMEIDPSLHLFPLVSEVPMRSRSAEILLMRQEGDRLLVLNTTHNRKDPPLSLRVNECGIRQLTTGSDGGDALGVHSCRDYRDVAVMEAIRMVPGSPWMLVAKEDQSELFEPMRRLAYSVFLMVFTLLFSVFLAASLIWRHGRIAVLEGEIEARKERKALTEKLAMLTRHANDVILLTDMDGRLLDANEKACEVYGYSFEELRRMNIELLRAESVRGRKDEQLGRLAQHGADVFETLHVTRVGAEFPVEVSSRLVVHEGQKAQLAIVRDISLRKHHEQEIERLSLLYGALAQVNQMLARVETPAELFSGVCRIMVHSGQFWMAWVGRYDRKKGLVVPVASDGHEQDFLKDFSLRTVVGGNQPPTIVAVRDGKGQVCTDFGEVDMGPWKERLAQCSFKASAAFPIRQRGVVWGNLTVYSLSSAVFGSKECMLLEETANEISYALDVMADRRAHRLVEDALRDSEMKFRTLFETMSEIVAIYEMVYDAAKQPADYRVLDCNPAFCSVFGFTRERVIGALGSKLFGMGHAPFLSEFSNVVACGQSSGFEAFFEPFGRHFSISVVSTGHGRFATVSTDITSRKQAESDMRESERRFRATFEHAAAGIAHLGLDGVFLRVNQRFCDLLGYTREEMISKNFREITHPEDLALDANEIKRLINGELETYSIEKRYLSRTGVQVWGQLTVSMVRHAGGTPQYFIVVVQDVGQRKQAELALKASEERYRRLTQAVTDYIYTVVVKDGVVTETLHGEGCVAVTGYTPEDFLADPSLWISMVLPEDRELVLGQAVNILGNCEAGWVEHRIKKKDGSVRWVRNTCSPNRQADGQLVSYDGILQDITERKTAELSLKDANEKLTLYATQMETLVRGRTAELEAANKELEAFSYSVSHDLRAPLRAINGFAQILEEDHLGELGEEARRHVSIIFKESSRLGVLIDELLALSRFGRHALKYDRVDMSGLVDEVRAELLIREMNRKISWDIGELPSVWGDPVFLRQVWVNLLGNAIKYTRKKPEAQIELRGRVEGSEVIFSVKDNGAGFDMKQAGRLFGVFQRLHSEKDFEGTGVGLVLCQRIITRHGGRIWAEGAVDKGAAFYFAVPKEAARELKG